MGKNVVVIASGRTEQFALPFLVQHLIEDDVIVTEVRYPSRNGDLVVETVTKLVVSTWFEKMYVDPPDKIVVLVDVDGKQPSAVLDHLTREVTQRIQSQVPIPVLFAYAQWHLEAWFFGDSKNLREFLGRDLGSVDASFPDEIEDPKRHLANLIGNSIYTSRISGQIAQELNAATIAGRSPSFSNFLKQLRNGEGMNGG